MKINYLSLLLLLSSASVAFGQQYFKNELVAFGGLYSGGEMSNTFTYGQQYTHWMRNHLGVGIGTFRSTQEILPQGTDIESQALTKQDIHRYWDAILMTRYQLGKNDFSAGAGISADKFYKGRFAVQEKYLPEYSTKYTYLGAETSVTVSPAFHLQAGYAYHLTPKISLGVHTRYYFGKNPAHFYGAKLSYHFDINPDSLGLKTRPITEWGAMVGGGLVNDLYNTNDNSYRVLLPYAGMYLEKDLSMAWKLRFELMYAKRGFSTREVVVGNTTWLASKFRGDFLQLPIVFENEFAYRWQLTFGPHFSLLLNNTYEVDGKTDDSYQNGTVSMGFHAGISRDLTDNLAIDSRFMLDFLTFSTKAYYNTLNDFRLGLRYKIK